ncbi:MAG: hypothetical protein FJX70_00535 [Alphaproteobacteria bacterium]|jgi:hypothetical protein|nr:hypothetical protein [Alphaproteobacteria bacterium]
MNLYSIYASCGDKNSDPVIIKQGFSPIAGVFNLFWAVYHRMWLVVILVMIANFIIISFRESEVISLIGNLKYALQFFSFGFFATEIREYYARLRGMKLDDIILATSEEEAELKYMTRTSI